MRRVRRTVLAAGLTVICVGVGAGCEQILWTAAVGPGLLATRLSDRSSKVTFQFLDADEGTPIAGAGLQRYYVGDWFTPHDVWQGETNAAGEAVIKLVHGYRYELHLQSDGYVLKDDDVPASARTAPPPKRVEIRLQLADGWVRDRTGVYRADRR